MLLLYIVKYCRLREPGSWCTGDMTITQAKWLQTDGFGKVYANIEPHPETEWHLLFPDSVDRSLIFRTSSGCELHPAALHGMLTCLQPIPANVGTLLYCFLYLPKKNISFITNKLTMAPRGGAIPPFAPIGCCCHIALLTSRRIDRDRTAATSK